jgi:hypothetical protein
MILTPREHLLKMQRIILRQIKASVKLLQGEYPQEFNRYFQAYERETREYQKISSKAELIRSAKKANIVFGGDFHPFAQSQRTHLRILRELIKGSRKVILAIEVVDSKYQNEISKYLSGKIDDQRFLKNIKYFDSWGFPWENYKVLFEFAKENDLEVVGINDSSQDAKRKDLFLRDSHSAAEIAKLRLSEPKSLIYVIFGDLHLASSHLPKLTKKYLGKNDKTCFLTIFQNSESLYWRLAKRNLEEKVDVVKLRPDAYCVVNAPPWLKWQAYLQFLETSIESDELNPQESADRTDHIFNFINMIKQVWNLKGSFNDFHIYSRGDLKPVLKVQKLVSKKYASQLERLIKLERSFFVSDPPLFYLTDFYVNHAAALAGQYIHSKVRGEQKVYGTFPKDFIPLIWIEAIGFFASKVVNHRRKFSTIADLPSREQVTLLVLEQRLREQIAYKTNSSLKFGRKHRGYNFRDYFEAARVLGSLLGNKIYLAFKNGQLDFNALHTWLEKKVEPSQDFLKFYSQVIVSLRPQLSPKSKHERL